MPKITLNVPDEMHERLNTIAAEVGINSTDMLRRAIGLLSVAHSLIQETSDDLYLCTKDSDGALQQQHVVSGMMY